jgi:hypothetical protein
MPRVIHHGNGLNFGLAQDKAHRRALMTKVTGELVLLQGNAG